MYVGMARVKSHVIRVQNAFEIACTVNKGREDTIAQAFKRNVYHALRQKDVTLDHVEKFREDYARTLNLKKCARMVHQVLIDRDKRQKKVVCVCIIYLNCKLLSFIAAGDACVQIMNNEIHILLSHVIKWLYQHIKSK